MSFVKVVFDYGDEGHFQPPFERTPVTTVGFQRPISSNLPVAPISGIFNIYLYC